MKKYITTHEALLNLDGRLVSCRVNGQLDKQIFRIRVEKDEIIFIRQSSLGSPFLFASSNKRKIEKNTLKTFTAIELINNEDELILSADTKENIKTEMESHQTMLGELIIEKNKDVLKKLNTSPLDFNKYLDKKFKVENNIENIVDDFRSVVLEIWLRGIEIEDVKKLQELTHKLRSL